MKTIVGKCTWVVLAAVWIAAAAFYGSMPERMATHWNAGGVVNGYSSRAFGLLFLPVILLVIQGIFLLIPRIDPLKENIETFRNKYEGFVLVIALFLAYVFGMTVLWNMGFRFDMGRLLAPAIGGMMYGVGAMIKGIKRNWFVGIRTPWTMSSDEVWDRTHLLGSKLFKLSGLIALMGIVLPDHAIALIVMPILATTIVAVVYSYVLFRRKK